MSPTATQTSECERPVSARSGPILIYNRYKPSRLLWPDLAQRLKRQVLKIVIENCEHYGTVKVIACIEDPAVVNRILNHLEQRPNLTKCAGTRLGRPQRPPSRVDLDDHQPGGRGQAAPHAHARSAAGRSLANLDNEHLRNAPVRGFSTMAGLVKLLFLPEVLSGSIFPPLNMYVSFRCVYPQCWE